MAVIRAIQEAHGGETGRGRWLLWAALASAPFWGLIFIVFA
jgi:hypothetical protein